MVRVPKRFVGDAVRKIGMKDYAAEVYCLCGANLRVRSSKDIVERAVKQFLEAHQGAGHGLCDATTCALNRNRAELKALRVKEE